MRVPARRLDAVEVHAGRDRVDVVGRFAVPIGRCEPYDAAAVDRRLRDAQRVPPRIVLERRHVRMRRVLVAGERRGCFDLDDEGGRLGDRVRERDAVGVYPRKRADVPATSRPPWLGRRVEAEGDPPRCRHDRHSGDAVKRRGQQIRVGGVAIVARPPHEYVRCVVLGNKCVIGLRGVDAHRPHECDECRGAGRHVERCGRHDGDGDSLGRVAERDGDAAVRRLAQAEGRNGHKCADREGSQ